MTDALKERLATQLAAPVDPAVSEFARILAHDSGALGVLFYGSNLRTRSLDGVLDFYVLLPGDAAREPAIWPRVSYHERTIGTHMLRAKVAMMRLDTFAEAASGERIDTTIWARFVQPCALVWVNDDGARVHITDAVADAAKTAARLAAVLGPATGTADEYWRALFRATYKAEFRVEKAGRENDILAVNAAHFAGLLPAALEAAGIGLTAHGDAISPHLEPATRKTVLDWWKRRERLGKPLNLIRLIKASTTFEGATRYAAWKIERHTGMPVAITPFRERYPILAAPSVLWSLWRHRRGRSGMPAKPD